jgi:hypothetical protein
LQEGERLMNVLLTLEKPTAKLIPGGEFDLYELEEKIEGASVKINMELDLDQMEE